MRLNFRPNSTVGLLAVIVLLIAVFFIAPLLTIASLNTVFGLSIAYNVWTWLSVVWLQMVTFGGVQSAIGAKNEK